MSLFLDVSATAFLSGLAMSLSLLMAIGPQNVHLIRMGLQRQHVWLTVAVCTASDVALIGLGVWGLAGLGGLSDKVQGALVGAGVIFLATYGWGAAQRAWRGASDTAGLLQGAQPLSVGRAVLSALAFSWLNPHAWLDTAVLIGSASLAWGRHGGEFGLGAMAGSTLWFLGLALLMLALGRRLGQPGLWRALDGMVAIMMWGTAAALALSLAR
ncbi:LysE/ArgO family amino acid transporter [Amphibiibacter pelophylacis]|uniref:LysE family transporter n=1 Tax=Amphibiibacter pelophylacis TaxID=1799477 RepID=A0ACC6NYS3_9BURK